MCRGKTKDDLDALTDGIDKAADFADTVAVTGVETLLDPTTLNPGVKAMKMVGKGVGKILGHTDEMRGATRGDDAARTIASVPGRVLSRINVSNSGWAHVVGRHFGGTGSQFSIAQGELRALLGSKQVVGSPVLRTLEGAGGTQYLRQIEMGQMMGVDKFTGANTSTLTVISDGFGNLVTTFPGILR